MELLFNIAQIVLAILLMLGVLLQQRGAGLGAGFGGDSAVFTTKRGAEKVLYNATIVIAIIFFTVSLVRVIVFA
ncbi:preprotein translocase subunit SecG [Candidatus Uhrbacteria bacterium RIFCSPHIGHO2_02_FULL_53_13]|uniref:Protein-export membrane protein SecG n=2 Tax=Candidatus Uhriibacteriota TaxID=1752732 RepID=A0A1F7TYD8_9BACT|nr:MAG: preprotein translocase subunit SecG [Candidatus Uhrbacteria bacterium RIFCSPHIGHO2_02_FULL_53_13]OGL89860.1 MAG: preprotein translocase subunit SecG [Candidatus Uhrbacteria bacterium RIFCSPLOWO2_02_FULL_53_10]